MTLTKPEIPDIGMYDLFFDKFGFVRRVSSTTKVCESCGAVWTDNGQYSSHCDPEDF